MKLRAKDLAVTNQLEEPSRSDEIIQNSLNEE